MARAAKGEGSLYEYRDGFRSYVTVKGKRKYFYFPHMTKSEASERLRALLNQRDNGILPKGKNYTLAVWMRHWLKTAELRPGVRANYDHNVNHYIVPEIGHIKLRDLEPEDLEALYLKMRSGEMSRKSKVTTDKGLTKLVRKPLSPRAVINVHSNIRRALTVATQRGHVGRNVATLVEPPQAVQADTKSLSLADAKAVLKIASSDRYAARWYLGLVFGLRPGEVLGLTWPDVDLATGTITIRRQLQRIRGGGLQMIGSAKTEAGSRRVSIPPNIVAMLTERRQAQMDERIAAGDRYIDWEYDDEVVQLVFTQPNGRPVDIGVDTRRWKLILDAAGLPHERRYIGRHTAASVMIDMGMDVAVVSSILGHAKTSFTYDTYVHPMEDKKKSAADKLGALYA